MKIYDNLYTNTKTEFYSLIDKRLKNQKKTFIVTANPETYMNSKKDKKLYNIINDKNNYIVPDGVSIVKSARFLGLDIKERITGIELAEHLLEVSNRNKYKVYLFGSTQEVINDMKNIINDKYPRIDLVGTSNGYVDNKDKIFDSIKSLEPDVVMVALGIPYQEKIIDKHINRYKKGVFIGVGGSFDVISGNKRRAPKIFIKLNLEWLYRITKEPKRLKKFIKYNVMFIIEILKEKTKKLKQ